MSTTSAYGWNIPDNTDLVKDGALAIRTLGNAIDTSMNTALGTKKAGMVLLNTTSFSAVSTQSLNNVFTSTYTNYRIVLNTDHSSAGLIRIRFRASGADNTTSNYYFTSQQIAGASWSDLGNANADTTAVIGYNDTNESDFSIDIFTPQAAFRTAYVSTGHSGRQGVVAAGVFDTAAQFDGFTLIPGAGTMTGTVSVYGYNK
jgi:hypothetical protein